MSALADPSKARESRVQCVEDGYRRGWSFVPLNGKKPRHTAWTTAPREAVEFALEWAQADNIGVRTGPVSGGLIVIDIDVQKGGSMDAFDLPQTVTVETGGGGRHLYFQSSEHLGNGRGSLPPHVDVRGQGGQVVAAGSVHPETGVMYRYAEGCAPWEIPIAPLPVCISVALKAKREPAPRVAAGRAQGSNATKAMLAAEVQRVRDAVPGTRNDTLNSAAFRLGAHINGGELCRDEVERALLAGTSLPREEAVKTIQSGLDAGIRKALAPAVVPAKFNLTDAGNGERFAAMHQHRALFDASIRKWRVWDDRRWDVDSFDRVITLAIETARQIACEAWACTDESEQTRLRKHAARTEQFGSLRAMVELARAQPGMAFHASEWDPDPWMLNVCNGTVDLRRGELLPHDPSRRITRLAPVEFDQRAGCRRFCEFLREVFQGDTDLIGYVQRFLGMCLTGDVSEQILVMMVGSGANGKSTLVDVVMEIMGDYASVAPPDLLGVRRNEEHPTELADLMGRRMVIASETERSGRFALQRVKRLTGDAVLKARRMREDYVEFPRLCKTILVTNNPPQVDEDSEATWRRIRVIPFDFIVPESRRDRYLLQALREERAGILQWLVRGCVEWCRTGLAEPKAVTAATERYRRGATPARYFIRERCTIEPSAWTSSSQMKDAYSEWCSAKGLHFESEKSLIGALRAAGCEGKKRGGVRGWAGVKLSR